MPIARPPLEPEASGPLDGIRVLDLSRLVAGNTLSVQLADFGAEVIKVESAKGDSLRDWRVEGVSAHWKTLARNKKSLRLDLRDPADIGTLKELATKAHVFIESFKPGTLEAMGLAPSVLHAANPSLVIVRISGFGQTGPYRARPGFGTLVEGMSGFATMNGFPDREPLLAPMALADSVAGLMGAVAVLAAIREVEMRHGAGQVIDVPLFDPLFSILGPQAAEFRLTGRPRKPIGNRSPSSAPRNVYRTSDGKWVSLSTSMQSMAIRLFKALGRDDMVDDPRYATPEDRHRHADELDAMVAAFIARMTQEEAVAYFEKAAVTVAPIYDISQILEDPHFQERGTIVELPDADLGFVPISGIPVKLSGTPGRYFRPAPGIGEHTDEILGWLRGGAGPSDAAGRSKKESGT